MKMDNSKVRIYGNDKRKKSNQDKPKKEEQI